MTCSCGMVHQKKQHATVASLKGELNVFGKAPLQGTFTKKVQRKLANYCPPPMRLQHEAETATRPRLLLPSRAHRSKAKGPNLYSLRALRGVTFP